MWEHSPPDPSQEVRRQAEPPTRPRLVVGAVTPREAARERILDAATTAFGEHGYRGASLASIGRSIQMTQQGVLYHFPTKVALLLAVLEERDRQGQSTWPRNRDFAGTEVLDVWDATVADNVERYGLVRLAHVLGAGRQRTTTQRATTSSSTST